MYEIIIRRKIDVQGQEGKTEGKWRGRGGKKRGRRGQQRREPFLGTDPNSRDMTDSSNRQPKSPLIFRTDPRQQPEVRPMSGRALRSS